MAGYRDLTQDMRFLTERNQTMKMYKKSELTIIDGMIVNEATGDIISLSPVTVFQANELDTLVQKAAYLAKQPKATPMPTLDGFERKSIKDNNVSKFTAHTPLLDYQAARTMAIMDELDDQAVVDKANELLDEYADLLAFVKTDYVVGSDVVPPAIIDTPTLGSILELKESDIVAIIAVIVGLDEQDEKDEEADHEVKCIHVSNKEDMDNLIELLKSIELAEDSEDSEDSEE